MEQLMKQKGEDKVWKDIYDKNGILKNITSTQTGQKLLLDDTLFIYPLFKDWVQNKVSRTKGLREKLITFFEDDDFTKQRILEILLMLSVKIKLGNEETNKGRQISISQIENRLFGNSDLDRDTVWRIVEGIVDFSKIFDTKLDVVVTAGKPKQLISYTSNLSESIIERLSKLAVLAFYPAPISSLPILWQYEEEKGLSGGYSTYQYDFVRSRGQYDNSLIPEHIFKTINNIQNVPWQVNVDILDYVERDIKRPVKSDYIFCEYPNSEGIDFRKKLDELGLNDGTIKENNIKLKAYYDQIGIYSAEAKEFESEMGKYSATILALGVARHYEKENVIYFPHNLDSRGRIYPLSIGLSPQGSDSVKAMLQYKNRATLSKRGLKWAWSYLASLYGDDKLDFEDRVIRGKELINVDYKEADEPYQFLAHQLEVKMLVEDPNYKTTIRVHLDACNSGSQFTSAITGDIAGCLATNVFPTYSNSKQIRQDAYILVSDKSLLECNSLISNSKEVLTDVTFFRDWLLAKGRKICKRPVMVSNYGGTAGGRTDMLEKMMIDEKVDRQHVNKKTASMMSKIIGNSIEGVLNGGKAFEQYIHKANNIIAKDNRPVVWTTGDGFIVTHVKYKQGKRERISVITPNSRKRTEFDKHTFTTNVDARKMKSAIAPNYIHSLDAELLRRVARRMFEIGIVDSDWIHDSFGCNPNHVDKMLEFCKEEFIKLVQEMPLERLHKELRKQASKKFRELNIPRLSNISDKIELLRDSDWFFS